MLSLFPALFAFSEYGPLVLRLALGAIFIAHGYPKLFTRKIRVPLCGSVEFFGGMLLLAGFLTQLAALFIAIDMALLIWKEKLKQARQGGQGFVGGYEFELALAAMAIAILVWGPGAWSLDLPF